MTTTSETAGAVEPGPRGMPAPARQTLAGAAGGFLVFLLLESMQRASSLQGGNGQIADGDSWRGSVLLVGGLFGSLVTGLLVVSDELFSGSARRVAGRAIQAAAIGAALSMGYSVIGNLLYESLAFSSSLLGGAAQAMARMVGWAVFGLGAGLGAGIVTGSERRAYLGCLGGLAGGFLGGCLFAFLAALRVPLSGHRVGRAQPGEARGGPDAGYGQCGWLVRQDLPGNEGSGSPSNSNSNSNS